MREPQIALHHLTRFHEPAGPPDPLASTRAGVHEPRPGTRMQSPSSPRVRPVPKPASSASSPTWTAPAARKHRSSNRLASAHTSAAAPPPTPGPLSPGNPELLSQLRLGDFLGRVSMAYLRPSIQCDHLPYWSVASFSVGVFGPIFGWRQHAEPFLALHGLGGGSLEELWMLA